MGRMWLLWHLVSVFSNGMYGVPVETYGAVSPTRSLSEIDANAMKEISEDIHENIIFSPDELMMIARKVKHVEIVQGLNLCLMNGRKHGITRLVITLLLQEIYLNMPI